MLCTGGKNTVNRPPMTGDRTELAVQRIEAALARIADAADAARARPEPSGEIAPSVAALVDKHERLRETVAQALGELDAVLSEIAP